MIDDIVKRAVAAERKRCVQAVLSAYVPHYMAAGTVRIIVKEIDPDALALVDDLEPHAVKDNLEACFGLAAIDPEISFAFHRVHMEAGESEKRGSQ
ncbi:hypothetical protein ASD32_04275 [Rhizobium sp. Root483D2]|nr:hypothetical protein ASD32_04275 [Rhizobium sp. Root483D2]